MDRTNNVRTQPRLTSHPHPTQCSPYCGTLLGYYGAEVIKIEPLGGGDQIRKFRDVDETGTSWWWYSIGRNKKSVCVDLRKKQGQELIREMVKKCDVLVENFKPGTMEKWDLGWEELKVCLIPYFRLAHE